MEVYYNYIKSLHLIFVITWFAGLFYIPRIFIYHIEAQKREELEKKILGEQFKLMAKRLWYIITWPSAILASIFAFILLYINPGLLLQEWMIIKLFFVGALYVYQFKTHRIYMELQREYFRYSSFFMRLWNELATLILFSIVFLVVLKSKFDWFFGVLGLIILTLILTLAVRLYKRWQKKT
tara:strand:- start:149 stop:691 length:543 start_codon:yes stop_codon:yes gene_type:complete